MRTAAKPRLALFDLDHTLLAGDSDMLWCEFLLRHGVLDTRFAARNAVMEAGYRAGTVSAAEFAGFYVSTLAGRSVADWAPLRERFLRDEIVPRIPLTAMHLVAQHRTAGALLVLTTATNRFLSEPTAAHLDFEHLIATECGMAPDGRFTGSPTAC